MLTRLQLNGIWLLLFLGRWAMVKGWIELVTKPFQPRKAEFVSVDARYDTKQDTSAYEMLSHDKSAGVTPLEPVQIPESGRRTPDYFGNTARYHAPSRSYSNPRPPPMTQPSWDPQATYARQDTRNPLDMNNV